MRRLIFFCCVLLCCSLAISFSASAKGGKRGKGGNKGMTPYSKETLTTVKGEIISIDTVFNKVKKEDGLHLTVKNAADEYIIHVCPQWFADKEELQFTKGETVTVSGSKFLKDKKFNIYAAKILLGSDETLHLRDPDTGDGLWSGRHKGEKGTRKFKQRQQEMEKRRNENMQKGRAE
jgi:hypothetical protein